MKRRILMMMFVFGLLLSVFAGCASQAEFLTMPPLNIPQAGSEMPSIEYSMNLRYVKSQPTKVNVYKFVEDLPDAEEEIQNLSILFGLSSEAAEFQDYDDFVILNDGRKMINYEKLTGTWTFVDNTYDTLVKHSLPSDESSVEIARNFLKDKGLYNDRFTTETVVTQYSGSELDETYSPYCKAVYFYPQVDGYQILGVSRIIVEVGEAGEIVSVMKYYKDFEVAGEVELAAPQTFTEGIRANSYSSSIRADAVSASINDVQLGYWEDAGSFQEQPYLQPVWIFSGESIQTDGTKEKFDIVVQAAKNVQASDAQIIKNNDDPDDVNGLVPTPDVPLF